MKDLMDQGALFTAPSAHTANPRLSQLSERPRNSKL